MTYDKFSPSPIAPPSIEDVIAKYGALRVLLVAFANLLAGPWSRPRPTPISELDDKLRRDVDLPPAKESPRISPISPYLF